eukprot:12484111-Alexandrium_andersonii.AAC.1
MPPLGCLAGPLPRGRKRGANREVHVLAPMLLEPPLPPRDDKVPGCEDCNKLCGEAGVLTLVRSC